MNPKSVLGLSGAKQWVCDRSKNDASMGQIWDFMAMEDISRDKIATEVTLYK